jgi:hypothetical protein
MFVLTAFNKRHADVGLRGVYSSEEKLRRAVDYWRGLRPDETLAYEEWETDYAPEALYWGWCYIPVGANRKLLGAGGGRVPRSRFFGKNLIGRKWT